jgi:uncharacterized membrane protein YbhN (UPF0104 family)
VRRLERVRPARLLTLAVALAVVGVVFGLVLPRLTPYGLVWRDLRTTAPGWIAALVAAVVFNLLTFPLPWLAALPDLGAARAFAVTQASTALTLVVPGGAPAGMAASYAMLRRGGVDPTRIGRAVALTGIWSQLTTYVFPAVAFALLAAGGTANTTIGTIALAGAGLFAGVSTVLVAAFVSERLADRAGGWAARAVTRVRRLARRPAVGWDGAAAVAFRRELLRVMRRRWRLLTLATLVNELTGYAVFQVALLAAGVRLVDVTFAEGFAGWAVGRLLSAVPLTPAGAGFTELGLTGLLIAFGGARTQVVTAVLVYRAASIVPTVLVGGVAGLLVSVRRPSGPVVGA